MENRALASHIPQSVSEEAAPIKELALVQGIWRWIPVVAPQVTSPDSHSSSDGLIMGADRSHYSSISAASGRSHLTEQTLTETGRTTDLKSFITINTR